MFAIHVSDKALITAIYKTFLQIKSKLHRNIIKQHARSFMYHFLEGKSKCSINTTLALLH